MLTCDSLTLIKNDRKIFSNLGFSISTSSALIVRGKNGSGKTSLLKIIAGLTQADSGEILWDEINVKSFRSIFNGDIQFIGHKNFLKQELSVLENLAFYSKLYGTSEALRASFGLFGINSILDQKVKTLSAGMQKKVILSRLLACPTTIWLLDEPSTNLDKEGCEKLKRLIANRVKDGGIVILSTHDEVFFDLGPHLHIQDFI